MTTAAQEEASPPAEPKASDGAESAPAEPPTDPNAPEVLFISYVFISGEGTETHRVWRVNGTNTTGIKRKMGIFRGLDPDVQRIYCPNEPGTPNCGNTHAGFRKYLDAVGMELTEVEAAEVPHESGKPVYHNRMTGNGEVQDWV